MSSLGLLLGSWAEPIRNDPTYGFLAPIIDFIESALLPIMIVLIAVAAIYAIILGVNMAKAESAEKREEAKKRIINFIIGAVVIIVVLIIVYVLAANINSILNIPQNVVGSGN